MAHRPCLGCGVFTRNATSYCDTCAVPRRRAAQGRQDRGRPGAAARGYDRHHQALRAQWSPLVEAGSVDCWRCHHPIEPGTPWHLGHVGGTGTPHAGPEHRSCNLAASNAT